MIAAGMERKRRGNEAKVTMDEGDLSGQLGWLFPHSLAVLTCMMNKRERKNRFFHNKKLPADPEDLCWPTPLSLVCTCWICLKSLPFSGGCYPIFFFFRFTSPPSNPCICTKENVIGTFPKAPRQKWQP